MPLFTKYFINIVALVVCRCCCAVLVETIDLSEFFWVFSYFGGIKTIKYSRGHLYWKEIVPLWTIKI